MTGWNDERVELLRKLWQDGLTAAQVARELGGVTRNGVIGKIHRIGMSGRDRPQRAKPQTQTSAKKNGRTRSVKPKHVKPAITPYFSPIPMPAEPEPIPVSRFLTIHELMPRDCRWPIGDPHEDSFRYCGAHTDLAGVPYCRAHTRLAYGRAA